MLYEILKSAKLGTEAAPDMFTGLIASKMPFAKGGGEIAELSGVPPLRFKSNGKPLLDWQITGNTIQNGTPTPSNPVMPNGVGLRTINLFSSQWEQGSINADTGVNAPSDNIIRTDYIEIQTNIIYSMTRSIGGDNSSYISLRLYDANKQYIGYGTSQTIQLISGRSEANPMRSNKNFCCFKVLSSTNAKYMRMQDTTNNLSTKFMLVEGKYTEQTMPTYEPYGYKIPISSASIITPNYLGDVQTTRQIKKRVFRGLNSDGWYYNSSSGEYDTYRTNATSDKLSNNNKVLCTHFPNYGSGERIEAYENSLYIYVKRSEIGSLTQLIQFLQQQYAAGTPVTVWYVLAEPTTGIVNEPLMKIGGYADTLSNATAIPTTKGANSITVDTTVQPSKVYIKYKK